MCKCVKISKTANCKEFHPNSIISDRYAQCITLENETFFSSLPHPTINFRGNKS